MLAVVVVADAAAAGVVAVALWLTEKCGLVCGCVWIVLSELVLVVRESFC